MTDRKTASLINDAELDQLYAELDRLTAELADYDQRVEHLTRQAARPDPELRAQLAAALAALGKSETELAALRQVARGYCPTCGRGDAAPAVQHWEQQRQRAEQAEELLRIAHDTSNRSEAERALAVQRAERAEAERDHLAAAASPADVTVRAIQLMQEAGRERDEVRAAIARALAWADELDEAARQRHPDAKHPAAVGLRARLTLNEPTEG